MINERGKEEDKRWVGRKKEEKKKGRKRNDKRNIRERTRGEGPGMVENRESLKMKCQKQYRWSACASGAVVRSRTEDCVHISPLCGD